MVIMVILWEGFETIILPRRVTRRLHLSRYFFLLFWRLWNTACKYACPLRFQETWLSFFGPLSILLMLFVWVAGLITSFALLHWAVDSLVSPGQPGGSDSYLTYLYLSGTTFFTLGLGDVVPGNHFSRFLTVLESGMGFGFLALLISYLPALNQSFVRREVNILLLDARAGSPPSAAEMLRRHHDAPGMEALREDLQEWERWSAELLEVQLSFPILAYFRSQHDNCSWIGALTTILDTCAFLMVGLEGTCGRQAELTFAMARHAVVDLSLIFKRPPQEPTEDRLPPDKLARLRRLLTDAGFKMNGVGTADQKLTELRKMYEPYITGLAAYFSVTVPSWLAVEEKMDNWQVSAWEPRGITFRKKARRKGRAKSWHW